MLCISVRITRDPARRGSWLPHYQATGTTDFTFEAVAWIYEHDAAAAHSA
jgi:hypothetical protein